MQRNTNTGHGSLDRLKARWDVSLVLKCNNKGWCDVLTFLLLRSWWDEDTTWQTVRHQDLWGNQSKKLTVKLCFHKQVTCFRKTELRVEAPLYHLLIETLKTRLTTCNAAPLYSHGLHSSVLSLLPDPPSVQRFDISSVFWERGSSEPCLSVMTGTADVPGLAGSLARQTVWGASLTSDNSEVSTSSERHAALLYCNSVLLVP